MTVKAAKIFNLIMVNFNKQKKSKDYFKTLIKKKQVIQEILFTQININLKTHKIALL